MWGASEQVTAAAEPPRRIRNDGNVPHSGAGGGTPARPTPTSPPHGAAHQGSSEDGARPGPAAVPHTAPSEAVRGEIRHQVERVLGIHYNESRLATILQVCSQ